MSRTFQKSDSIKAINSDILKQTPNKFDKLGKARKSRIYNDSRPLEEKEIENLKKGLGKLQLSPSQGKLESRTLNTRHSSNVDIEEIKRDECEKKNIFYRSFKNIQERFQYREQRINKIQMFNERVQKQLTLPPIKQKK